MKKDEKKSADVQFVKWFSEMSNKDVAIAGGKGASLAEMANHGLPIPPGFVVTAQAYQYFIEKSGLNDKMKEILGKIDVENTAELNNASKKIKEMIKNGEMSKELSDEILEAYDILDVDRKKISGAGHGALEILKTGHEPPFVAVRSSATTEDLADASFAGQQESFLNVKGNRELIQKVKECFASLFTARAIYYRTKKGFAHDKAYLAVVVQRMVDSEKSGVIFSQNPVSKEPEILIEAVWGLGEGIVSGRIKPDSYVVNSNLEEFKITKTEVNEKKIAIVRNSSGKNEIVRLTKERSRQQVLTNYEIKRLAQYALQLENHYDKPQDIEFAIEGNGIYIVQSRPITTKASEGKADEIKGEPILSGLGASPGIGSGTVKIVHSIEELDKIKKGDVLVTEMTNPDMVVAMQKSAAIVTDEGGLTSHASIVSREMGIPAVVGTGEATKKLKDGGIVTVDGYRGKVYAGKGETKEVEIRPIVPTKTKIKVIVDLPDFAERAAKSGAKDVGLVRLEGIIAGSGKHPLKYASDKKIEDYIVVLVAGLTKIAVPFEEVWIRSSDIRTDEYRNLEGAPKEVEGNPMLGNHGIRFSLKYPEILKAELTAIKELAADFPNKKIGFMAPQIISVDEVRALKKMATAIEMPKNVKIGIMVETPAAVQIINSLCEEGIDFISLGTNDLTQFTLAIDRNNTEVQDLYNEMNPAILNSISYVIRRCRRYNVETSICGQAASRLEMAKFLVNEGINSLSVNADAAYDVSKLIAEIEGAVPSASMRPAAQAVKEEKKEKESQLETGQEIKLPEAKAAPVVVEEKTENLKQDIEDIVLGELGEDNYEPGAADKNADIPKLNDAIPVDSAHFDEKEDEKEIELNEENEAELKEENEPEELGKESDLSEEWTGEVKK